MIIFNFLRIWKICKIKDGIEKLKVLPCFCSTNPIPDNLTAFSFIIQRHSAFACFVLIFVQWRFILPAGINRLSTTKRVILRANIILDMYFEIWILSTYWSKIQFQTGSASSIVELVMFKYQSLFELIALSYFFPNWYSGNSI